MVNVNINSMILIGIVGFVIVICLGIIVYILIKNRKKDEEEIAELMDDIEKAEERLEQNKEVKEVGFVEKKSEIEEMLERMQHDLEAKTEDVVEKFEQEQEEKSIISYQELVKSLKGNQLDKVAPVKEEKVVEPNKNIEIDKISEGNDSDLKQNIDRLTKSLEKSVEDLEVETKKFKSTDFISPVYGKMEEHLEYPKVQPFSKKEQVRFEFDNVSDLDKESKNITDYLDELEFRNNIKVDSLEQTLNMPPISAEIKKNDEFLQALKEFRKNLE